MLIRFERYDFKDDSLSSKDILRVEGRENRAILTRMEASLGAKTVGHGSRGVDSFRHSSSVAERKEGHGAKKGEASNASDYDYAPFERFIRVVAMVTVPLISTSSSANDRTTP